MLPSILDPALVIVPDLEDVLEIDSKASALSKTFPLNMLKELLEYELLAYDMPRAPLPPNPEAPFPLLFAVGALGTVAITAGPKAALCGVIGNGVCGGGDDTDAEFGPDEWPFVLLLEEARKAQGDVWMR